LKNYVKNICKDKCLKAAIECYTLANPKGRWLDKNGAVNVDECYTEIVTLADKFVQYVSVE